jgi:hypothetical protein
MLFVIGLLLPIMVLVAGLAPELKAGADQSRCGSRCESRPEKTRAKNPDHPDQTNLTSQ